MDKSKLIRWIGGIVVLLLILALCFDSASEIQAVRSQLETVDTELKLHEERYLREISSFPNIPGELTESIQRYRTTDTISARHRLFNDLTTQAQRFLLGRDPSSNQLERKMLDEMAGALNRRQIAERHFQEALQECKRVQSSWRGTLGGVFSGGAQGCE